MPTFPSSHRDSADYGEGRRSADEQAQSFELARRAAEQIREATEVERHEAAVVLGTGLAQAAQSLGTARSRIEFSELEGFPDTVAAGQRPEMWSVEIAGKSVLVMRGRPHLYEGHPPARVVLPVRTAIFAGCRTLLLTNASGAIRRGLSPGQPVLISDHLNMTGVSPLSGLPVSGGADRSKEDQSPGSHALPVPFVDLTDAWSPRLRALARSIDPSLQEGVYAQLPGPHFETPAEIRMLRTLGADLVGMSSAIELIAARHLGAEVLGISLVSNVAAGVDEGGLSGESVVEVARESASRVGALLEELLVRLLQT